MLGTDNEIIIQKESRRSKCVVFNELQTHNPNENIKKSRLAVIKCESLLKTEPLSSGHFSLTFRATWSNKGRDYDVVLKTPKINGDYNELEELFTILHVEPHPNVVKIIGFCPDFQHKGLEGKRHALILQYQEHGDLDSMIKDHFDKLTDMDKINIALGMARGVAHLHDHNIIHRDIALRNFLVNKEGRIIVTDFGLSRAVVTEYIPASSTMIPWRNSPPETLETFASSKASDVWMFGVALWQVVTGQRTAFPGYNTPISLFSALSSGVKPTMPDHVLSTFRKIIETCCELHAGSRPTMKQIIGELTNTSEESTQKEEETERKTQTDTAPHFDPPYIRMDSTTIESVRLGEIPVSPSTPSVNQCKFCSSIIKEEELDDHLSTCLLELLEIFREANLADGICTALAIYFCNIIGVQTKEQLCEWLLRVDVVDLLNVSFPDRVKSYAEGQILALLFGEKKQFEDVRKKLREARAVSLSRSNSSSTDGASPKQGDRSDQQLQKQDQSGNERNEIVEGTLAETSKIYLFGETVSSSTNPLEPFYGSDDCTYVWCGSCFLAKFIINQCLTRQVQGITRLEVKTVEKYENERFYRYWKNKQGSPLRREWSVPGMAGVLLDPPHWSNQNRGDMEHFGLPDNWKWIDEWKYVVDKKSDKDGWMYAFNFHRAHWRPKYGKLCFVRKRKWVRMMKTLDFSSKSDTDSSDGERVRHLGNDERYEHAALGVSLP